MPEIPQISATGGFDVPVTAGVQRLNADRPNPAATALQDQGKQLEQQAAYLATSIQRQNIATQAMSVENSFISKSTDLDTQLQSIQDPSARLAAAKEGIQQINDDVLAGHPDIAPHVQGQLAVRQAEYLRNANLQFINDSHAQAKAGIASTYTNTLAAIAAADPADRAALQNNFHQYVEQTAEHGFFDKGEDTAVLGKFDYDVKKTLFDTLAAHDPAHALAMPLDSTGLKVEDWMGTRTRALEQVTQARSIADVSYNQMKDKYLTAFRQGQTSQAEDEHAYKYGTLTADEYKSRYGKVPTDEESRGQLLSTISWVDNFEGSAQDLERAGALHVIANTNLKGDDRAAGAMVLRQRIDELKSDQGRQAQTNGAITKSFALRTYGDVLNPNVTSNQYKNAAAQIRAAIQNEREQSRYAKNPDEVNRIHQETIKQIRAIGDPIVSPTPTGTPVSGAPATAPSGPPDETGLRAD